MYKVFLVEDEIVTREGIRDNVDWAAAGFEFCGEAPDGEIALPLIETSKPDVLITDIKMPFMDGLQLSKIIREHMPWIKIIILSGHNEFEYAQSAVKLGVTEYLLKPVSAKDLNKTLTEISSILDQENKEREVLKNLQEKVKDSVVLSREKFLLQLVMGGISSADAIGQSQQLGLDIVAQYYLVVFISVELCSDSKPFDIKKYNQVEQMISEFAGNNPNVFLTKKDLEELVLLLKGDELEQLVQEGEFLAGLIKRAVEQQIKCNLVFEMGRPKMRLGDIHHSFSEALVRVKSRIREPLPGSSNIGPTLGDSLKIDHIEIENYLKFGALNDFDPFFRTYIQPLGAAALNSYLVMHYLFVDILLTATQFVSDLGGDANQVGLEIDEIESILSNMNSIEQIKEVMRVIFTAALNFRNKKTNHERSIIIQQAKAYIDSRFTDPDLLMSKVAGNHNISSSHFSTVFHQELGETFRDYLSKLRINHSKTLLSTTNLKVSEIAKQSGFNDPHYFSFVFKKKSGLTPQQFRAQSQNKRIGH